MQHIERLWKTPWSGRETENLLLHLRLQMTKDGKVTGSSICAGTFELWGLSLVCWVQRLICWLLTPQLEANPQVRPVLQSPTTTSVSCSVMPVGVVLQLGANVNAGRLNAITWPVQAENNGEKTKLWNIYIKLEVDRWLANYACKFFWKTEKITKKTKTQKRLEIWQN